MDGSCTFFSIIPSQCWYQYFYPCQIVKSAQGREAPATPSDGPHGACGSLLLLGSKTDASVSVACGSTINSPSGMQVGPSTPCGWHSRAMSVSRLATFSLLSVVGPDLLMMAVCMGQKTNQFAVNAGIQNYFPLQTRWIFTLGQDFGKEAESELEDGW